MQHCYQLTVMHFDIHKKAAFMNVKHWIQKCVLLAFMNSILSSWLEVVCKCYEGLIWFQSFWINAWILLKNLIPLYICIMLCLSNSSYLSVYQVLQLEEKLFRIKGILSPQKKNALTSGDLLNEPMTDYPRTILKASSTHKEEKKE